MTISIVIPSFNGQLLLEKNLPAIIDACRAWDATGKRWEIVVVDDASTDTTVHWLKDTYPRVKIIENKSNLRFGRSCNRGVRAASGDVIVLLNNDVVPERGFLTPLLIHFEHSELFAVGCKEVNIENGNVLFGGRGVMRFQRGFIIHWRPTDQTDRHTTWVSAGSAAYRRPLWLELGGMDQLFRPAYEEDRDLCWQALKAGHSLVFEPDAVVTHQHETTNKSVFGSQKMAIYSMKNQLLFVWKNISSTSLLAQHLFWLPYHLVVTTIRTRGLFFLAFTVAILQLLEARVSKKHASKYWRRSDEEVLAMG